MKSIETRIPIIRVASSTFWIFFRNPTGKAATQILVTQNWSIIRVVSEGKCGFCPIHPNSDINILLFCVGVFKTFIQKHNYLMSINFVTNDCEYHYVILFCFFFLISLRFVVYHIRMVLVFYFALNHSSPCSFQSPLGLI